MSQHLNWSANQGHIITGAGTINKLLLPNIDYRDPQNLPHHYLNKKTYWETFWKWKMKGRRSDMIVGAWSRPIAAGGWLESGEADTVAYNLQTPSLFADIRFPTTMPGNIAYRGSLSQCTDEELRYLSRQHCFAGYSLLDKAEDKKNGQFTRYHIIDWNYHPSFPRPRPNRWRAECNEDNSSFKEYSVAKDDHGVPVYFERWARYPNDSNGQKYLVAWSSRSNPSSPAARESLLIIVGQHFAFVRDRSVPFPSFQGATGPGGPALVDFALNNNMREEAEAYLDLEGSYGRIRSDLTWIIERSTHPWRSNTPLFNSGDITLIVENGKISALQWLKLEFVLFECSFTNVELGMLFKHSKSKL